jgi:hypothetical protein
MFDSIDASQIPADAQMVAGYVNGIYAWSAADWARFPHAVHVTVTVNAGGSADVLDVENGDASPAEAPGWIAAHPNGSIYCDSSTWPAVRAAFGSRPLPPFWIANYNGDASSIPAGAVAAQYEDAGPYDLSVVADYWPGVDPAPSPSPPPVPSEDIVTPADAQLFVSTLMATKVAEAGDPAPNTRTVLELFAYLDQHYHVLAQQNTALAAQVTALSAALAAVAKGETAVVEAAVTAALKAAGHAAA